MASRSGFQHATPPFRTFSGEKALAALPKELDRLGRSRAVVVGGPWLAGFPAVARRVEDALGPRLAGWFNDVEEHSPVPSVLAARDCLKALGADSVIAVGGGSSIVTARAATILLAESGDVKDLSTQRRPDGSLHSPRLEAAKIPNWVIPSTPITAYAKAGSAVRDPETGGRLALFDPKTRAQGVFFDPEVAGTAPLGLVTSAALNSFSMAIESLQAGADDPLADALLMHALRMLVEWMPRVRSEPNAPEPRLQLMAAALLCGQGSDYVGGGLAQAISHAAGPRSAVANGTVEAMLLPHTMQFSAPVTEPRMALIADILDPLGRGQGGEQDRAISGAKAMLVDLGLPQRLRDVAISRSAISAIVSHALEDWSITRVPRPVGPDDLTELLESAW